MFACRSAVHEPSGIEKRCHDVPSSQELFAAWLARHGLRRLLPEFIDRNSANLDALFQMKFNLTSDETTLFMLNFTIFLNTMLNNNKYTTFTKLPDWLRDIQSAANVHNKTERRRSSTLHVKRELDYAK